VLDDDHRVAGVDQPMQHADQFVDIGHVQTESKYGRAPTLRVRGHLRGGGVNPLYKSRAAHPKKVVQVLVIAELCCAAPPLAPVLLDGD
jgi:hypothetical protein